MKIADDNKGKVCTIQDSINQEVNLLSKFSIVASKHPVKSTDVIM